MSMPIKGNKKMFYIIFNSFNSTESNLTTFLNPYSYLIARKNKDLFKNFNIKIDGILLVKMLNIAGIKVKRESFDMTSIAPIVFRKASNSKQSIFIIGTTQEELERTIFNLKQNFLDINIIGFRNGYFKNEERNIFLKYLAKVNPDIVICGMGTLMQEYFLVDLKKLGWNGIGYTCGGFLHQSSKTLEYYPRWIDKYNFRWIYRLYKEPSTRKRFLVYYPKFIFIFLYDLFIYKIRIKRN